MLLAAIFSAINLVLLASGGIRLGDDSPSYIAGARELLQGDLLAGRPGVWLGYQAVIALCEATGAGLGGVIALQLAFAALAGLAQYALGRELGGSSARVIAAGLLVANPDIARFHAYILTDSLYTSAVILSAWAIHQAPRRGGSAYLLGTGAVLAAALLRPNGWLLLPVAASYWIAAGIPRRRLRWLAIGGTVLLFVASALALPSTRAGIRFEDPAGYLRRGEIVSYYQGWRLPMPADTDPARTGAGAMLTYAVQHPAASSLLGVARIAAELAHARPFYSVRHNAALLAILPLLYLFAVLGFLRVRAQPLAHLLLAVIASHLLVAAIVGADWDGRYLLFIFPLICVFSACGIASRLRQTK